MLMLSEMSSRQWNSHEVFKCQMAVHTTLQGRFTDSPI